MTLRQQYANEEVVHKLRSMLNDLPTLRTRAIKKLEHWREAAIKRLLARQRELEKTLLDKFERLEFDTQLFVEKSERKKVQQQRRWQTEPIDYLNQTEIDRISSSLRSIREELEQSKLILAGSQENVGELLSDEFIRAKVSRHADSSSAKTAVQKNKETSSSDHDLGLELRRVLEICTSPQYPLSSLSTDQFSPVQSLDHAERFHDVKSKHSNVKIDPVQQTKHDSLRENGNRRHARLITDVAFENEENETTSNNNHNNNNNSSPFASEQCDDSTRRFQRLREIRKTLRDRYDDRSPQLPTSQKQQQQPRPSSPPNQKSSPRKHDELPPVHISVERIPPHSSNADQYSLHRRAAENTSTRDRRYRSKTLEVNKTRAVDNQIYECASSSSNAKPPGYHRSDMHKHQNPRLSMRRSSEDMPDKYGQSRRHGEGKFSGTDEIWFDIGQEHWTNLLEHGWRPTLGTPGVTLVALTESNHPGARGCTISNREIPVIDLYDHISRQEYVTFFDKLEFAYTRTIDLGNEFWRFLEINGNQHLCLYHQLNKQFIMYKPDMSLLSFPWPYDGIVDISWSQTTSTWAVATQTQIIICNHSFSKVLQSIDVSGDWPKRITSCRSSIFHTYKIASAAADMSASAPNLRLPPRDRPQFLLERFDYRLNSICKHILESSTIWDVEADDVTEHLGVLCDVALLIFDYQLNLLRQIEVTGFKVSTDHFGGWLVADYNASCIWQIRRNEYLKAHKILHVERPWSVILDRSTWTLTTLSETQSRAKRLLFFAMKNVPGSLLKLNAPSAKSQSPVSTSSSTSDSLL